MEISREIELVRASLDTIRSSITNLHSSELQYLAKELESELIVLNNIEQWLNTPNATEEDLKKTLSDVQKSPFTLVIDNRENASRINISAIDKQQLICQPRDLENTALSENSEKSDDISTGQTTNLVEDPLKTLLP